MRRWVLVLAVMFFLACHTPGKYPLSLRAQGMNAMDSFRINFLQGRLCDAAISFEQALSIFKRIDDMCLLSDAYIQKYLFYAYGGNEKEDLLQTAREFAAVGQCEAEMSRIEQIGKRLAMSGYPENTNDIYHSVTLRKKALAEKERKWAHEALGIDRTNGWTLFIILDYDIIFQLSDDQGEKEQLRKRIDILKDEIQVCD